jgi:hypothetical protein
MHVLARNRSRNWITSVRYDLSFGIIVLGVTPTFSSASPKADLTTWVSDVRFRGRADEQPTCVLLRPSFASLKATIFSSIEIGMPIEKQARLANCITDGIKRVPRTWAEATTGSVFSSLVRQAFAVGSPLGVEKNGVTDAKVLRFVHNALTGDHGAKVDFGCRIGTIAFRLRRNHGDRDGPLVAFLSGKIHSPRRDDRHDGEWRELYLRRRNG